jgi:hypothetical protein
MYSPLTRQAGLLIWFDRNHYGRSKRGANSPHSVLKIPKDQQTADPPVNAHLRMSEKATVMMLRIKRADDSGIFNLHVSAFDLL